MLTTDLASAAIELCTEVALPLTDDERSTLATMLARDPGGSWTHPHHLFPRGGWPVVQARVLAGMVLLDEDVLVSGRFYRATEEAFRRMAALVDSEPLRPLVANVRRAKGDQRITLTSGKRVSFVTGVPRGMAADLCVLDPSTSAHDVMWLRQARPNVQLVIYS
jgi:hypothetical protein